MVEEDKRFFKQADENGDGSLNPDEYMAFFFPHNYPHMHSLELERYLQQNDADGDGKISLKEFSPGQGTFPLIIGCTYVCLCGVERDG